VLDGGDGKARRRRRPIVQFASSRRRKALAEFLCFNIQEKWAELYLHYFVDACFRRGPVHFASVDVLHMCSIGASFIRTQSFANLADDKSDSYKHAAMRIASAN
jgi:hypothetical protein